MQPLLFIQDAQTPMEALLYLRSVVLVLFPILKRTAAILLASEDWVNTVRQYAQLLSLLLPCMTKFEMIDWVNLNTWYPSCDVKDYVSTIDDIGMTITALYTLKEVPMLHDAMMTMWSTVITELATGVTMRSWYGDAMERTFLELSWIMKFYEIQVFINPQFEFQLREMEALLCLGLEIPNYDIGNKKDFDSNLFDLNSDFRAAVIETITNGIFINHGLGVIMTRVFESKLLSLRVGIRGVTSFDFVRLSGHIPSNRITAEGMYIYPELPMQFVYTDSITQVEWQTIHAKRLKEHRVQVDSFLKEIFIDQIISEDDCKKRLVAQADAEESFHQLIRSMKRTLQLTEKTSLITTLWCQWCGSPASLTCSKCRTVTYCSQPCQRGAWPLHKKYEDKVNECTSYRGCV